MELYWSSIFWQHLIDFHPGSIFFMAQLIPFFLQLDVPFEKEPTHPTIPVSTQRNRLRDWHCCLPNPVCRLDVLLWFTELHQHPLRFYYKTRIECYQGQIQWMKIRTSQLCGLNQGLLFSWWLGRIFWRYRVLILHRCWRGKRQRFVLACWSVHTWYLWGQWLGVSILFRWLIRQRVRPTWRRCQFVIQRILGWGRGWFW